MTGKNLSTVVKKDDEEEKKRANHLQKELKKAKQKAAGSEMAARMKALK